MLVERRGAPLNDDLNARQGLWDAVERRPRRASSAVARDGPRMTTLVERRSAPRTENLDARRGAWEAPRLPQNGIPSVPATSAAAK